MAIIVDKVKKRKEIALSCSDLLLEKGIKNITISELASCACISKGLIYDYFKNKEDIVFEIIRNYIYDYHKNCNLDLPDAYSTKDKLFLFFSFLFSKNKKIAKHKEVYREYLSITLSTKDKNLCFFNCECSEFKKNLLVEIIKKGIERKEIVKDTLNLVDGFLAMEKGFLILSWTESRDCTEEFKKTINTIYSLMEVKNEI